MKTFLRKSGRCTQTKACVCTQLCCLCSKLAIKKGPTTGQTQAHAAPSTRYGAQSPASHRIATRRAMLSSRLSLRAQLMRIAASVSNASCWRVVGYVLPETTAERNDAHSTPFGRADCYGKLVQRIIAWRCMERQRCQRTACTSCRQRSFLHDLRKSSTR